MKTSNVFRLLVAALIVLATFADVKSAAAQQISVSPARILFRGEPGQTVSQTVLISNSGDTNFEFITSIRDWKRDSLGNKLYQPSGTLPHSNANQLRLDETNFIVGPHQKKTVTVYLDIPKNQQDTIATNSMLFFTQTNPSERKAAGNGGIGIKIGYEFGIQVFYNPAAAQKGELEFDSFAYTAKAGDQQALLTIGYHNSGTINKTGQLRVELTKRKTGEEIKLKGLPVAIMPLGHQYIRVTLPDNLPKGAYLAMGILDTGSGYRLKIAEKNFDVQ